MGLTARAKSIAAILSNIEERVYADHNKEVINGRLKVRKEVVKSNAQLADRFVAVVQICRAYFGAA